MDRESLARRSRALERLMEVRARVRARAREQASTLVEEASLARGPAPLDQESQRAKELHPSIPSTLAVDGTTMAILLLQSSPAIPRTSQRTLTFVESGVMMGILQRLRQVCPRTSQRKKLLAGSGAMMGILPQ